MRLEAVRMIADWLAGYVLDANGAQQGVNQMLGQNLLLRSEQFDQAPWVNGGGVTITVNAAASPLGTMTADDLNFTTTVNTNFMRQTYADANPALKHYTFSFYEFDGTLSYDANTVSAQIRRGDSSNSVAYTKANGGLLTDTSVTLPAGWRRLYCTYVADATTNADIQVMIRNGVAPAIGNFKVWGAQLRPGDAPPVPYRQTITATAGPFPVDSGDALPTVIAAWTDPERTPAQAGVAVFNETHHAWAANRVMDPPATPCLSVIAQGRILVQGEPTPDGQIRSTTSPVQVAIRYLTADSDTARAVANGDYVLRAVQRSLRELSKSANEASRQRNGVLLVLFEDPMELYPIVEVVGETYVAGALVVNCQMRDYNPSF